MQALDWTRWGEDRVFLEPGEREFSKLHGQPEVSQTQARRAALEANGSQWRSDHTVPQR